MGSKKRLIGVLALAVVLIAVGLWLFCCKDRSKGTSGEGEADGQKRSLVQIITTSKGPAEPQGSSRGRSQGTVADRREQNAGNANDADDGLSDDFGEEPDTPEEKAVKRWEELIAVFYEETDDADEATDAGGNPVPNPNAPLKEPRVTLTDQLRIRDAFREMSEENRMEEVHHAMNLLPDESVAVMYGVLFDLTQPEEIMDVIFSDILNRDESIKNPMMEEIVKDKDHPMYVESARILDVIKDE